MNEFVDNPDCGVASVQQGVGTSCVHLFVHENTSLHLLLYMPWRHKL